VSKDSSGATLGRRSPPSDRGDGHDIVIDPVFGACRALLRRPVAQEGRRGPMLDNRAYVDHECGRLGSASRGDVESDSSASGSLVGRLVSAGLDRLASAAVCQNPVARSIRVVRAGLGSLSGPNPGCSPAGGFMTQV
jgi:hypothetical protein